MEIDLLVQTQCKRLRFCTAANLIHVTGALLDRITHQCHIIECHGDSYRFKQSMKKRHALT